MCIFSRKTGIYLWVVHVLEELIILLYSEIMSCFSSSATMVVAGKITSVILLNILE